MLDGELREFVPQRVFRDAVIKAVARGEVSTRVPAKPADLEVWMKTKFGYIPVGKGSAFTAMMRRRSVGGFADVPQ